MSTNRFDNHTTLVVPLSHFGRGDLALAGGKGANLGELFQAGFNVPPGFIITTAAYDLLLQENDFQTRLASLLASLDLNNPHLFILYRFRTHIQLAVDDYNITFSPFPGSETKCSS